MLRILHDTKIDFIKAWRIAAVLTVAFIVIGLGDLAFRGVKYSIEFTSGTLMQLEFKQPPDVSAMRAALDRAGIHGAEIQQFGSPTSFTVRAQGSEAGSGTPPAEGAAATPAESTASGGTAAGAESVARQIQRVLNAQFGEGQFTVQSTEAIGPRVGSELRRGAILAVLASFLLTLVYLAIRFEWRFGVAAVVATAHDIFTTLAFIKLMNLEISLTVVAAILTVIGYSLNDTIIIFDRVRENLRKKRKENLYDTLNRSVNETLPRSVMTHATTSAAVFALLLFAGEVIRPFAWVMLFGIVTGTFSSIYVASPILLWIETKYPRQSGASGGVGPRSREAAPSRASRSKEPAGAR